MNYLIEGWLATEFQWVQFVQTGDVLLIAPLLVAAAILLAGISSLVSLSRYTRV